MEVRAQYKIGFAQKMGFSAIIKYANTTTSHEKKIHSEPKYKSKEGTWLRGLKKKKP